MKTMNDVYSTAAAYISDRHNWSNTGGQVKDGKYCLVEAVGKAYMDVMGKVPVDSILPMLMAFVPVQFKSISEFNDQAQHYQVMRVLDDAISATRGF